MKRFLPGNNMQEKLMENPKYAQILPLIKKIDALLLAGSVIIAIDGNSASGKSTLANFLASLYECNLYRIDDYFLPLTKRTKERLNEIGGNIDRERFLEEVLLPTKNGLSLKAQRYDCKSNAFLSPVEYTPKKLTIIEGCYSLHPALAPYYNLSVFMSIYGKTQRERIIKRNSPTLANRFFNEWIPMENAFFEHYDLKNNCSIHLDGATLDLRK